MTPLPQDVGRSRERSWAGDDRASAAGHIAEIQRGRLIAAAAAAISEEGAANVTVTSIVERARVSRRTFYELFGGIQQCLSATFEDAVAQVRDEVVPAWEAAQGAWRGRVRAGLTALLALLDRQPWLARLLVVEWPAVSGAVLEQRSRLFRQLARVVEEGEAKAGAGSGAPSLTSEGVVGAVTSILHARLLEPESGGRMLDLLNPLMSIIVLPYMGSAAARRELDHPAPPAVFDERDAPSGDLAERLGIRITYRTVLVLRAIGAHPGASNRMVSQAAGVLDQGQISKLLRRLERAGLVENSIGDGARGAPNAWTLTPKGERLERSLSL